VSKFDLEKLEKKSLTIVMNEVSFKRNQLFQNQLEMKKTSCRSLILFGFVFSLLTINVTAISQTVQWQTIFGNPGSQFSDIGYNCIQSEDGTYLSTGRMEIPIDEWPFAIAKSYVARLDSAGNLIWVKLIGDSSVSNESFTLAEDTFGNIYVPHYSAYAHLAKLDPQGRILWDKEYSEANIVFFRGMSFQDNYRNIVLLGLNYVNGLDGTTSVTKLDSSGHLIWSKPIYDSIPTISTYSSDHNSFCFLGSGYYVCGAKGVNPYIVKLDTGGNIIWNNRYLNSRGIWSIDKISDKSFVASCQLSPGLRLIKIDSSGNQYWTRDYSEDTLAGSIGSKKILGITGNRFALGTSRGEYYGRLMVIDSSGKFLSSKFLNFSENFTVNQYNLNFTSDSGFICSGFARYWTSNRRNEFEYQGKMHNVEGGKDMDILIFKTDKVGNTTSVGGGSELVENFLKCETFPNPGNNCVNVSVTTSRSGIAKVRIYDVMGRLVKQIETLELVQGSNTHLLNFSEFSSGIYILKLEFFSKNLFNKILIIK